MAQVTGRQLKVGDVVRGALCSLRVDKSDRPLGPMLGVVVAVYPNASSGARGQDQKPRGKVKVHWASGSTGSHDSYMVVKVDEPAPVLPSQYSTKGGQ